MARVRNNGAKARAAGGTKRTPPRKSAKPAPAEVRERYHHGDLAESLRVAALQILHEVGVDAFTLREAARRVGVNHRAVYRHFDDKRALLAELAAGGYRVLAADMRRAVATQSAAAASGAPSIDALLAIATTFLTFARRERARYQLMFGPRLNEDNRFPDLEVAIGEAVRVLEVQLLPMNPLASRVALRDAGITVFSAVHGMSSLVLARRVPLAERKVESYVRTIMRPVFEGLMVTLRRGDG